MVSMTTPEVLLFWSAQTSTSISALDRAYAKASACGSAEPSSNRMDVILVFIFLFFSKYNSFNVHMFTNNAIACAYPFLVFGRASNVHMLNDFINVNIYQVMSIHSVARYYGVREPIPH